MQSVIADGAILEIDALILAINFDAITGGLQAISIINSVGGTLSEKWPNGTGIGPGLMTADFPKCSFCNDPKD